MIPTEVPMPKDSAKTTNHQNENMGFVALEKLLEEDQPDLETMRANMKKLSDLAKSSKNTKEKAAARKASIAYQRFFEMLEELMKVRQRLQRERNNAEIKAADNIR